MRILVYQKCFEQPNSSFRSEIVFYAQNQNWDLISKTRRKDFPNFHFQFSTTRKTAENCTYVTLADYALENVKIKNFPNIKKFLPSPLSTFPTFPSKLSTDFDTLFYTGREWQGKQCCWASKIYISQRWTATIGKVVTLQFLFNFLGKFSIDLDIFS